MVAHIIQRRVQKLPTSPTGPLVGDLHLRRHPKCALAQVLTVPLHVIQSCLDPALVPELFHDPMLPVEPQLHLHHPVEIRAHGKAHFVVRAVSQCIRVVAEWAGITVRDAVVRREPVRPFTALLLLLLLPPLLLSPRTPLRVRLQSLFLLGPRKLLAYIRVLPEPILVVPTHVGYDALVAFAHCFG